MGIVEGGRGRAWPVGGEGGSAEGEATNSAGCFANWFIQSLVLFSRRESENGEDQGESLKGLHRSGQTRLDVKFTLVI